MEYKNIVNTDLNVSEVCLGTADYGTNIDEKTSLELLDYFFKKGGNFLDTANIYGKWGEEKTGASEITIGKWVKSNNLREKVIIATKGCCPVFEAWDVSRVNAKELKKDLFESLENLQIDYIDLYYFHRDDINVPVEEILDMIYEYIDKGLVKYFGVSNWSTERIKELQECAKKKNKTGVVANQMMWSFAVVNANSLKNDKLIAMDKEMYEFHKETNLTAVPFNSQARGFFTKALKSDFDTNPVYDNLKKRFYNPKTAERIEKVKEIVNKFKVDGTQVALIYMLLQPFITIPVIGPKNLMQLESSLKALEPEIKQKIAPELKVYINERDGGLQY
ncbi:MAG: aldo/keto reductase [Promethearchaeota archaeon]